MKSFTVSGGVVGAPEPKRLALRLAPEGALTPEESLAATTGYEGAQIAWPIAPLDLIDYWMSSPWLAAVGKVLADAISSAEFDLKPRSFNLEGLPIEPDEQQYATGMAWLSRDEFAQDGISTYDFAQYRKTAALHMDQTGNLFLEVIRNQTADRPLMVGIILPQYVMYALKRAAGRNVEHLYQIDPYRGEQWFIQYKMRPKGDRDSREFIHQRLPNTISNIYGLPPWIEARDSVEVDNNHRRYLKGFFANHSAPRWMVEITQDPAWTGAEADVAQVEKVYQLVTNYLSANRGEMAGRNLVLRYPGGILVKAQPMDHKLEDPTFGATAKNARDEILAVRHVSLIDLGLPEGGYRATAETQSDNFRKQVLEPFAAPIVGAINKILHAPAPYGLGITDYDLGLEFLGVEQVLARIETIIKATGRPVLSADEGREILGYEPKGDDDIYIPANLVPVGAEPIDPLQ